MKIRKVSVLFLTTVILSGMTQPVLAEPVYADEAEVSLDSIDQQETNVGIPEDTVFSEGLPEEIDLTEAVSEEMTASDSTPAAEPIEVWEDIQPEESLEEASALTTVIISAPEGGLIRVSGNGAEGIGEEKSLPEETWEFPIGSIVQAEVIPEDGYSLAWCGTETESGILIDAAYQEETGYIYNFYVPEENSRFTAIFQKTGDMEQDGTFLDGTEDENENTGAEEAAPEAENENAGAEEAASEAENENAGAEEAVTEAENACTDEDGDDAETENKSTDAEEAVAESGDADKEDTEAEAQESEADDDLLQASGLNGIPANVELYYIDEAYKDSLTLPASRKNTYQIPTNGLSKNATFTVISGNTAAVSSKGLIEPAGTTYYRVGNGSGFSFWSTAYVEGGETRTEYREGITTIRVQDGNAKKDIRVTVKSYASVNYEAVLNGFIKNNIKSSMTELEKYETITRYVAENYSYDASYSSGQSMVATGGGDCWASTDLIITLCEKVGIDARLRNGNLDSGSGSGHKNVIAKINGKYYVAEAGYGGEKPRFYNIYEEEEGFSVSGNAIYQYDAFDENVNIPTVLNGETITAIGRSEDDGSVFSRSSADVKSIYIPETISSVTSTAFFACEEMTSITVASNNPFFTGEEGILYSKGQNKVLLCCPAGKTSVSISGNTTEIGKGSFWYCSKLRSVVLPKSVKSIQEYAFNGMENCAFYIPSSVTAIADNAFDSTYGCTIICEAGSYAETFAKAHSIPYVTTDLTAKDTNISEITDKTFTGKQITQKPLVKKGDLTLKEGTDYTLSYKNNVEPGKATVTITGKGLYKGSVSRVFTIKKIVPTVTPTPKQTVTPASKPAAAPTPTAASEPSKQNYTENDYAGKTGSSSGQKTKTPQIAYRTHVQTYGWQGYVQNGELSGTTGQSKRLEGINIRLSDLPYSGGIEYRTHVQTYGWQNWVKDNAMAGTEGEAKRLEAIQIRLTGEMAKHYDVYYQTHIQSFGWSGWASNGEMCGSAGYAKRLEGIRILLVEKGKSAPGSTANCFYMKPGSSEPVAKKSGARIGYNTHVQTYGWQNYSYDGGMAGTQGEAKRLEGIHISLIDKPYSGNIVYRTHVQTYGWQKWRKNVSA